jgi:hypothetical protein
MRRARVFVLTSIALSVMTAMCGGRQSDAPQGPTSATNDGGSPPPIADGSFATIEGSSPAPIPDSGDEASSLAESGAAAGEAGVVPRACVPGQSIACVGPGGCASNQVCDGTGSAYGPCDCAPSPDASTPLCIPGESIACAGAGGCISSQVCNGAGTGYGACLCAGDGGATLLCVPGESIACGGPYACASFQVCEASGEAYGPCDCPEGGAPTYDDGGLPDGYAPLPPPVGDQGYNAIWISSNLISPNSQAIFLPLYSAPDCNVVPPYGESYAVMFFDPVTGGPSGTFPACPVNSLPTTTCYSPEPFLYPGIGDFEIVPGGMYTLSAFNADGIATGQMNTTEGIVPLVVKNCQ